MNDTNLLLESLSEMFPNLYIEIKEEDNHFLYKISAYNPITFSYNLIVGKAESLEEIKNKCSIL